ncbi:MurR/RpiR family transcriptional regulator [Georgenia phoenicis]|uniref:MurR/RpiR family transcriptional regulator n=1 Tax=unclassified Georgenia TaxID=2626815 RepID=UPI0039B04D28
MWNGSADTSPSARIAALLPSLQRSERRVAEAVLADPDRAVDSTAQELADTVGVGRASVVRTAQTLGYDGYPQLRVALARERVVEQPTGESDDGALGVMRAAIARFGSGLPNIAGALTEEVVETFVAALDEAGQVVIAANGLSAPLGYDIALRLATAGRSAAWLPDGLAQAIAARQLRPGDVLLAVSGSGASRATLDVVDAGCEAGATVLAVTRFSRSALVERATHTLVVPPSAESFRDELLQTSRAAMALVGELLVEALIVRRDSRAQAARMAVLTEVAKSLRE